MAENDSLIKRVISVTSELTQLIAEENALLEARRPRDMLALQEKKGRLAAIYGSEIGALKRQSRAAAQAAPELIAALRQASERFQEAMAKHVRLVSTMRTVTEKVLKAISDEVEKRNNPVQTYGGNAALNRAPVHKPTSLALNRTI